MPLTGAWLEAKRAPDPDQATLHQVGSEHGVYGSVEQQRPPTWAAPAYQDVAPAPEVVGNEWVTAAPGVVLPQAPYEDGHDHAPGHATFDSGVAGANRRDVRFQRTDETYYSDNFDGQPGSVSELPHIVHQRGMNAEAPNNPPSASYLGEGFRRGHYRNWNVDRDYSPPWRRHVTRIVSPWTVTPIGDAPPPTPAGPYNSPFSSLERFRRMTYSRPSMRRIPEQFDESVISDGSETQDVYLQDWVT